MSKKEKFKKKIETVTVKVSLKNPKERTLGTSNSSTNTLVRPLRKAAKDGIIGKINYAFYEEHGKLACTFGAFCYTPPRGNKLLFFPGIMKSISGLQ